MNALVEARSEQALSARAPASGGLDERARRPGPPGCAR